MGILPCRIAKALESGCKVNGLLAIETGRGVKCAIPAGAMTLLASSDNFLSYGGIIRGKRCAAD
jgi:hypothetical protein